MSTLLSSPEAALEAARQLASEFARTAVARDRQGGIPKAERDAIRRSGLLTFAIGKEFGGSGGSWADTLAIIREFAQVDSSIAHLFAFHYYQLATLRLFGSTQQWQKLHRQTVEQGWFWGNALNRLEHGVIATPRPDGAYEWSGRKSFATGTADADYITLSGARADDPTQSLIAAIPAGREGITLLHDWDNIGQRQTSSGTAIFDKVVVNSDELLVNPGPFSSPFASARALIGQTVFANLYLAIADGAFNLALAHLRQKESPPWFESLAPTAQKDPFVLRHFGELWVKLEGARALTEKVNALIDPFWAKAEALTAQERGEFAINVAKAKVATTQVGLEVVTRIFEPLGARATTAKLGYDRFWRNLRTQTLHDPVDYKILELGDWILNGQLPPPSSYS
ncbi:FMNH2-dependent monooxygenase [Betaproteobacteria bacterium]|nr:FMNH2-dependent monooxygenase [Betaproteobacteria bacterium]GHU21509.1 FMNH2-dependent monooxygenase [Betaproteobacteria bacterium]GHU28966.1 FMNH2-dependent monooxygenase [Betaproteobacteria bacterium]